MLSIIRANLFSRYTKLYREIAKEHGTTVRHVYRLAHGKRSKSKQDYAIIKRLKEEGVIHTHVIW